MVVLVLYGTMESYQTGEETEFNFTKAMQILGSFLSLGVLSVIIGVLVGFIVTYLLKKCRFIAHSAIQETFLLFTVAFLTYYVSELLGQSGITSLVSCAIIMAQYAWYNLSPQGKHVTSITFQTFGYAAEAFVFSFIGLCVMAYKDHRYCWKLIVAEFFIVIIGRFTAISASYYMFECFKGDKSNKLNFREISFLTYAAFIRGAIAFGLVEKLDAHTFPAEKKEVVVSTTLCLVISTTFLFGGFTPMVQKLLLPSKPKENQTELDTAT